MREDRRGVRRGHPRRRRRRRDGLTLALSPGFHLGDHYVLGLLFLGFALAVAVGALSHQHERSFSAAVFYLGLGAIAAVGLTVLDVKPLDPQGDHVLVERLTELALVVAVFAAGLTVEERVPRESLTSIALLLAVVMPLTIAVVAGFAMLAMGLSLGAALLLGALLAPTDPVLAGDVGLAPPGSEVQGEPRLSLHTEAGLNDGLASPFVLLGIFVAGRGGTGWIGEWVWADLLYAVLVAVLLGAAIGTAAAWGWVQARERDLALAGLDGFAALALSLMTYGAVELVGAYGLLGVFVCALAFRRYEYGHEVNHGVHQGAEVSGTFLELLVLLLVGSMLTFDGLGEPGVAGWALAVVLLLAIRPVLVLLTPRAAVGTLKERAFLAFFGVRGVAALFYAAIIVDAGVLSAREETVVVWTAIACVLVSVVVHGIAATPLTRRLLEE